MTTADRHPTFRPGWLKQQVEKSVESLDSLPPKIRASLQQSTRRYRLVCPGVGERGHGLAATVVHAAGCCERFAVLTPAEQEKTGLRIPTSA